MSKVITSSTSGFFVAKNKGYEGKVAEFLFRKCPKDFNIRLSDGTLLKRTDQPKFTFVINDRKVFKKFLLSPNDLTVGKAFIDKRIDIEGDIFEVMVLEDYSSAFKFSLKERIILTVWVILFL